MFDAELVHNVVGSEDPNLIRSNGHHAYAPSSPKAYAGEFNNMVNVVIGCFRWLDCTTASYLNGLQVMISRAIASQLKLSTPGFLSMPKRLYRTLALWCVFGVLPRHTRANLSTLNDALTCTSS